MEQIECLFLFGYTVPWFMPQSRAAFFLCCWAELSPRRRRLREAAQQAGFSLLFEERLRTTETPPPRLLRVYHREVLETEELRLLLT